jgi:hypothetical protein
MRSRILPAVGVGAVALALGVSFASGASAHGAPGLTVKSNTVSHHSAHPSACTNQRDNDNGIGIVSQNFESAFDIYDSSGADNISKGCAFTTVTADGTYFNGSGPADSFAVTLYGGKSAPGGVKKTCATASYTDTGFGSPAIKCSGKTTKKTKWLGVVANMNFSTGGEWGWNTNSTQRSNPASWRNKDDGFSTGCIHFTPLLTCIPSDEGPDFSFAVLGS